MSSGAAVALLLTARSLLLLAPASATIGRPAPSSDTTHVINTKILQSKTIDRGERGNELANARNKEIMPGNNVQISSITLKQLRCADIG
jgi:hypothetical protein